LLPNSGGGRTSPGRCPTELTQLVKAHRTNHILHLLLTVFTAGLWLPVWIGVAAFGGGRPKTIAR
jgi:hypothetical protein